MAEEKDEKKEKEEQKNQEISKNQADAKAKTKNAKGLLPEGVDDGSNPFVTGEINTSGTYGMNVGRDILKGATFRKYEFPEKLEGVQLQYANTEKQLKVVNFKQDYVVLIRKKLFYAANSQGQIGNDAATIDDGNYIRSYKLDTFTSIRTNISIAGTAGNCQIELQGAERAYCFEESKKTPHGAPLLKGMISDQWPDNYAQIVYDSNNSMGVRDSTDEKDDKKTDSIYDNQDFKSKGRGTVWNRDDAQSVEYNGRKAEIHTRYQKYATEDGYSYGVVGKVRIYQNNIDDKYVEQLKVDAQNPDEKISSVAKQKLALLKYDESNGKWYYEGTLPARSSEESQEEPERISGWKIVEKCDFEPMDEVWVFGKSNFERDETGDFAMKQIFFGYIDTITKQHSAGKTAGCTVTISASDQLKLLDLSYVTMNPSMTPGISMGNGGIDLRFSAQDKAHFGTFEVFNPYAVAQMIGAKGTVEDASDAQKEVIRSAWRYLSLSNCFAGKPVCEIIKTLCIDAGIPTWYLKDRIEPIRFPPFVYMLKQANSGTLFNAVMQKRLQMCATAANKLMLEFFADEEGNIVLKVPNYILGANTLTKNNMGFSQLDGGVLNSINIDDIKPFYSAIGIDQAREQDKERISKDADDSTQEALSHAGDDLTPEAKQYYYQQMAERVALFNEGNYTMAANMLNGVVETNEAAQYISDFRTFNPQLNPTSQASVKYEIKSPDTFWSIAQKYLNTGERYNEILLDVREQVPGMENLGANECEKVYGQKIMINLNRSFNELDKNGKSVVRESSQAMYEKFQNGTYNIWQKGVRRKPKTQKDYERTVLNRYDQSLSEMTDALIPEIPQEYVISFNLTDSDKQLYNMYEVNIEGDFGIFDKGGLINKIARVFPDFSSMLRFGCRPAPQTISFPYMGNRENAHLLGFMLTAQSVAKRHSATLSMIEDSSIKVGNPIRIFTYDEHPDLPLYPQGNHTVGNTAYTATGANGNTATLEQNQMAQIYQQQAAYIKRNGIAKTLTGRGNKLTTDESDKTNGTAKPKDTKQSKYVKIPSNGTVLDATSGVPTPSKYDGPSAAVIASQTDSQSVYYVEQISRSIGAAKESTMTLTLTCGRMMGKPSAMDLMMMLYKTYYDPALGYVADLGTIAKYQEKYKGATKEHEIKPADTLTLMAMAEYPDVFTFEVAHNPKIEQTEDAQNDPYLLANILAGKSEFKPTDDEKKVFQQAIDKGWKKLTSIIKGKTYRVNPEDPSEGEEVFDYVYYVYDNSRQRWSFIRSGD